MVRLLKDKISHGKELFEGSKIFNVFSTVIRKTILALVSRARQVQFDQGSSHISIGFEVFMKLYLH